MAGKNIITVDLSIAPSFDEWLYSEYPLGNKPAPPSLLLYTDIIAGPTSGGEDNLGTYIRVTGTNFGKFSDWGLSSHLYIGGVEIANYRYLKTAHGALDGRMELCAQVGALGNPTPGTPLNITMSVRGNALHNPTTGLALADLDGIALTFTPQPGPIVFVALNGDDAKAGTIDAPLRHFQTYDAGANSWGGAVYGPWGGRTTANQIVPGTHIVARGGDFGADTSSGGRWVELARVTGTAPSGATNAGPICFMPYPGPAGANAPETVSWIGVAGSNGGFLFSDTQRSRETTPWGTVGYSKHIHLSNLIIVAHPSPSLPLNDKSPIEHQTAADYCRVVNCELSWRVETGTPKSGGIGGEGSYRRILGNYIHDIYGIYTGDTPFENHGIYVGNNSSADGAAQADYHSIIAYNRIEDIKGGNGMNIRGATVWAGAPEDSAPYISIHHNRIARADKHGIDLFDERGFANVWANTIVDSGQAAFFVNCGNIAAAGGVYFGYNSILGWGGKAASYPAVFNYGSASTGSLRVENNAIYCRAGTPAPGFDRFYTAYNGGITTFGHNAWYDATGNGTKPSGDVTGWQADPQFVNLTIPDLRPAVGSPLSNAASAPTSTVGTIYAFDAAYIARPQGANANWAVGAYEREGG